MLKKILIGVGILVALFAGLFLFVFTKTAGMADDADRFFDLLKHGNYAKAHAMTATAFQKATSAEQLADFSKLFTFEKLSATSYTTRGFENDLAYLEGNISYTDGTKQPMRIEFIKEDGEWKVLHVTPKAGFEGGPVASNAANVSSLNERQVAPPDAIVKALVNETVQRLADAIAKRNFDDFYSYTSKMWQSQTTSKALLVAFKEFIDNGIDLIQTQNHTIAIQSSQIDTENALSIDASWDTQPLRTVGNFRYIKEQDAWKLIGVSVNVK